MSRVAVQKVVDALRDEVATQVSLGEGRRYALEGEVIHPIIACALERVADRLQQDGLDQPSPAVADPPSAPTVSPTAPSAPGGDPWQQLAEAGTMLLGLQDMLQKGPYRLPIPWMQVLWDCITLTNNVPFGPRPDYARRPDEEEAGRRGPRTRMHEPWTEAEDRALLALTTEDPLWDALAQLTGRSVSAVQTRYYDLRSLRSD